MPTNEAKGVATTLHPSVPVPLFRNEGDEISGTSTGRDTLKQTLEKAMPRSQALAARLPPKIDPLTRTKAVQRLNAEQKAIKEDVREALLQAIRLSTNFLQETTGNQLLNRESGTIAKHIQAAIQLKSTFAQSVLVYDKNITIFLETTFEKDLFDAYNIKTIGKLRSTMRKDMQSLEESLTAVGMKLPIFVKALYYGEL